MAYNYNNSKKRGILLFVSFLFIALLCFGITAFLIITTRGTDTVNDRLVTISKIIVFVGIFFLVLAFGHILPALVLGKKKNEFTNEADPSDIFDESNMLQALQKYLPDGETLLAGIHAVTKESYVTCAFKNCVLGEDRLCPRDGGYTISISKKKVCTYDMYLGITQHYLVVADCQPNRYFYEYNRNLITDENAIQNVTTDILLKDVGKCFPLKDLQSCELKKGFAGSVNCVITLKNNGYFKLLLPKHGGLSGGMPHHSEYRDAIIACFKTNTK